MKTIAENEEMVRELHAESLIPPDSNGEHGHYQDDSMSEIFLDDFYPQTREEIYTAVKKLIGRCSINIPDVDIELAIMEAIEEKLFIK